MNTVSRIAIGVGADLADLDAGLSTATRRVDTWVKSLESRAPRLPSPGVAESGSGGAQAGSEIGGQIEAGLAQAAAGIAPFLSRFERDFNKVGATVIELAKRIDGEFKFPKTQAAFQSLRERASRTFVDAEGEATRFGRAVDRALDIGRRVHAAADSLASFGSVVRTSIGGGGASRFNFNPAAASMARLDTAAKAATSSFSGLATQVAAALGAFALVYKAVGFIKDGVKGASDLNETISKTDAILGNASGAVKSFADTMATKFGLVKQETLDIASSLGGLGKGLGGLKADKLSDFTTQFTKLAADLSSFKNISFQEAGKALTVGLSGEQSDTLKQLGVILTEDTTKAYALANGIGRLGHELTQQEKFAARAGLALKQLKDASGDLDRTADASANQFRKFQGNLTNFGTSIGQVLLPGLNSALNLLNDFGNKSQDALAGSKAATDSWAESFQYAIEFAGAGIAEWEATWKAAQLSATQQVANAFAFFEATWRNQVTIVKWAANLYVETFKNAFSDIAVFISKTAENIKRLAAALASLAKGEGFKLELVNPFAVLDRAAKALPDLAKDLVKPAFIDLGKEIDKETDKIAGRAQARVDELKRRQKAADAALALRLNQANGAGDAGKPAISNEIADFAKKALDDIKKPITKYFEDLDKIAQAQAAGLLTAREANLAKVKAFEQTGLGGSPKFSGAIEATSQEGYSALLAAQTGRSNKSTDLLGTIAKQNQVALGVFQKIQQNTAPKPATTGGGMTI